MALSEKEKKELMTRINKRFEKEKNALESKVNEGIVNGEIDADVLNNMVHQYENVLQEDIRQAGSLDEELTDFFMRKFEILRQFYKMVYVYKPSLFKTEIEGRIVSVAKDYDICVNKLNSRKDISKNLDVLIENYNKLCAFINVYNDDDLRKNSEVSKVLDGALNFVNGTNKKIEDLKRNNDDLKKSFANVKNSDSKHQNKVKDIGKMLSKYLANFEKAKSVILSFYPDKALFLDGIVYFLKDIKGKYTDEEIEKRLASVKESLLKNFGYDIENNTIKRPKDNNTKENDEPEKENASVKDASVTTNKGNNSNSMIALIKTMEDYCSDMTSKSATIINNGNALGSTLKDFSKCEDELKDLIKQAKNNTKSYDEVNNKFEAIKSYMEKNFGYVYKQEIKGRRRKVVSVKRLGLGIGGLAIGAYGLGALISQAIFFSKFGFLYASATPFILPVFLTLASAVMLKKAFSSKEKVVVNKFIEKMENKEYETPLLEDKESKGVKGR